MKKDFIATVICPIPNETWLDRIERQANTLLDISIIGLDITDFETTF